MIVLSLSPSKLTAHRLWRSLLLVSSLVVAPVAHAETLQEALISAYNTNPSLKAERARVREVDENYVQAKGQGGLTSSLSGSLGYATVRTPETNFLGQPGEGFETNSSEPQSLQLNVIQPIYQGGRVKALKQQAKAGIMAAREGLRNSEQSIFVRAANAYSDVLAAEETAGIRRNNVMVLSRQETAARDRFDVGEGTRTDISLAETRLAASEIGLASADAALQSVRAEYFRVIGHPPEDLQAVPDMAIPANLEQAQTIARQNNPQILASYFNEEAAKAGVNVAKSASRPTLSLNGSASGVRKQLGFQERSESAQIAATLTVPILSGGVNQSRIRAAKAAETRSKFESRDLELALDLAVAQTWSQLEAAQRSLISAQKQVEAAEVAFEGVELEQQVGTRSALDVLNAEQELLNAKLSVVNARNTLEKSEFALVALMGGFNAVGLSLPVDVYDPNENFERVNRSPLEKAVDSYVPEVIEDVADEAIKVVNSIGREAGHVADDIGLTYAVETIGSQIDDIPHEAATGAKALIDTATGDK